MLRLVSHPLVDGASVLVEVNAGREVRTHRHVLQIIDGREDAQLRELGDARDETEAQVRV